MSAPPLPSRRVVPAVIVASFLAPFMMSSLNVALPDIGRAFALSAVSLSWVVTSNILAAAMLLLPAGRYADLHGRLGVFRAGVAVYTVGAVLCGLAPGAAWLLAARVVNGVGSALMFSTGPALIMAGVPPERRGRALGWNVAAVYLGLSVGPAVGGVIASAWGWRWIFAAAAAIGLAGQALVAGRGRDAPAAAARGPFDVTGSALFGAALILLLAGCTLLPGRLGAVLLALGAAGLWGFGRWELGCADPVLDLASFRRNVAFIFSNLAALIHYAATAATAFLLSLYLEYVKGLPMRQTGLVLMAQPLVMTIFSPLAGRLSDAVAPWKLASAGMGLSAAGLLGFGFLTADTGVPAVVAGLAVLGFGFALFSSPNTNAIMSAVAGPQYGTASSVLAAMRLTGQMASMAIVTLVLAVGLGRVRLDAAAAPGLLHCLHVSFGAFFVLCLLGLLASTVRSAAPRGGDAGN